MGKRRTKAKTRRQAPPTHRRRARARGRRPKAAAPPTPPASPEEIRLLRLASELTALGRGTTSPSEAVDAVLARLSSSRPPTLHNGDKARALALGWAREQARLAVADVLQRAAAAGAARTDVGAETLAWLVFAGAEALEREPADAVADRLHALATFIRPPAR